MRVGFDDYDIIYHPDGTITLDSASMKIVDSNKTNIKKEKNKNTMNNKNLMNEVLEGIYNDLGLRQTVIPCFMSNPGLNKSSTIRQFARNKGVNLVPLVLSQRNPNEISGSLLPNGDKMSYFDYDLLTDMKEGDILFVDEVLNANGMVLNACLTILMERELISGKKLPNIMIVAASNPQGATRLTPQQKQRFVFYNLGLDHKGFTTHLQGKYGLPKDICQGVIKIINEEGFNSKEYNYSSARSVDLAIDMMIKEVPTPFESKLKSILNIKIKNSSGKDITLSDGSIYLKDEMKSWLELKRKNR